MSTEVTSLLSQAGYWPLVAHKDDYVSVLNDFIDACTAIYFMVSPSEKKPKENEPHLEVIPPGLELGYPVFPDTPRRQKRLLACVGEINYHTKIFTPY